MSDKFIGTQQSTVKPWGFVSLRKQCFKYWISWPEFVTARIVCATETL